MTWARAFLIGAALTVLALVVFGMVASSEGLVELGPYPTGDGDAVTVAPRTAP